VYVPIFISLKLTGLFWKIHRYASSRNNTDLQQISIEFDANFPIALPLVL